MELKVFKDTIAAYGGRWETRLELPVETEILIPDYLPAVFKIVKCLVEPVILQNHTAASKWQGGGVSALYCLLPVGRGRSTVVPHGTEIPL